MDFAPLIAIPVIYVSVAYIKPRLRAVVPLNICAICVAVSLTWLGLLLARVFGMEVSPLMIGILMGMSVSGLMYKLEAFYRKKAVQNFWFVRLILVVAGLYGVFMLLTERWNMLAALVVFAVIAIIIASFFFQGLTHEDVIKEVGKEKKGSLIKKLDNCC